VTPFNVFHLALSRKPIGESCLNWNGSLIGTLHLLEIYELLTEREEKLVFYGGSVVFRIWQRGAWRARGARAYNGVLGAEPPAGSRGRAPGGGGSGGEAPPEVETLFASGCSMETANSPIFLKFGNAKDHQTLLNFAILAEKWQKTHLFI